MILRYICLVFFVRILTITKQAVLSNAETQTRLEYDLVVQLYNPIGKIRGHILQSYNKQNFYAFQDIPYAQSTAGENRFKPPKPLDPWDGIMETTSNKKICPQKYSSFFNDSNDDLVETEDCLVLNVYSPVKPGTNKKLPVFFWIHGGAFFCDNGGISKFNPKFLIDFEIVIVTINYRLGPLGFLTTDDEFLPGNLGLKDQHFALQWTHNNIHLFGGDPQQITLGGHSAGAMAVGIHLISELNKGLFKGVIMSSGSAIGTVMYQKQFKNIAFEFGRMLDESFNSTKSSNLLKVLQKVTLEDISRADSELSTDLSEFLSGVKWEPIIEHKLNPDAIITGHIHEKIMTGNFNRVPILTGFTSEEALFFLPYFSKEDKANIAAQYDTNTKLLISEKLNVPADIRENTGKKLKKVYTSTSFLMNETAFTRFISDELFIRSVIRQADAASPYVPVYLYQLSWTNKQGVEHGADLVYLWEDPVPIHPFIKELRGPILTLWTNFIKTQNPTPITDQSLQYVRWPQVESGIVQYLNLNSTFEILQNPRQYLEIKNILNPVIRAPYDVY